MDWTRPDFLINGGLMWCGDRFLGSFSSAAAALEGLQLKRNQTREHKCKAMCESDHELIAAIDADED